MTRETHVARPAPRDVEPAHDETFEAPAVDIYETNDSLVLVADMPGVGEGDVEVSVENDQIVISGRSAYDPPKDARVLHSEFGSRRFRRAFVLPELVDHARISGRIQNGTLRVELPKAESAKTRKIPIKVE